MTQTSMDFSLCLIQALPVAQDNIEKEDLPKKQSNSTNHSNIVY